ncbi:Coenzyme F420 hydrogenase/dehydrogenase, beta subunit C-terminal domain [Anaerocolumna sp. MB42-C2]|uniref:Coenzyme F420 hydrogenase/dehydrogenase, beta subunit C-terminal domain n=1 Tax=Anaerocolumna sp. MB42-C2 TaxID=3070997 RepID=UPI0027DEF888|nr:Coenzyme F420 hydrogenase/dehydrogenase, beta subunit C-terminal domain [Anaerocolumna sp. MB42-C2]WMJ85819.1 Coenzyme F420 hydrogenase/dehydrogenase, beta subunit C-terminal domain [Anaerocolumna sp. MB42-C2]
MKNIIFGAYHKDDVIRMDSSSGGVFSAIAIEIINKEGYIFGANLRTDNNIYSCEHIMCTSVQELEKLRGSKYVPSKIGDTFKQIEKLLKEDKYILFCGTPCQVAGLISYLGKKYEKLYTIDFICHGVPIPYLLKKVIGEDNNKKVISAVDFRNKKQGWQNYAFSVEYTDGLKSYQLGRESKYMQLYLSDMYLRPSCYTCNYRSTNRFSDITLGDFWGVESFKNITNEDMFKGISVVVINSEKGLQIFHKSSNQLVCFESDISVFDSTNRYYKEHVIRPYDIKKFRNLIYKQKCDEIINKYKRYSWFREFVKKVKRKIYKII